jgi:hypothetical protein
MSTKEYNDIATRATENGPEFLAKSQDDVKALLIEITRLKSERLMLQDKYLTEMKYSLNLQKRLVR